MSIFSNVRSPQLLERISRGLLYALIFLTPLFFLPFTVDPLEINKQTLLVLLTLTAALAWLGSMHAARTISFRRGLINVSPLLFLLGVGLAAGFSGAPYLSWLGDSSQQYVSALSVLCYVAVFYMAANLFHQPAKQAGIYTAVLGSATLAGLWGLLSFFGVQMPFLTTAGNFNTVGTVNSLAIFVAMAAVLGNAWWVAGRKHSPLYQGRLAMVNKILTFAVSLVALVMLILLDYWVLWVVFLAGLFVLFVFVLLRASDFPDVGRLTLAFFLAAFSLLFLFWLPSPLHLNIPLEVTPSFGGSTSVMWQTVKAHPILGTGPGTFTFDYGQYHSKDINATSFWGVRFDRPASFALLIPATLGAVGTVGWLAFVVWLFVASCGWLVRSKEDEWLSTFIAFTVWFTLLVASFLYSSNLTLQLMFFLFSGLLCAQIMADPTERRFGQSPRLGLLLSFAFILIAVGAVTVIFISGQRYAAEIAFTQAVEMDQAHGDLNNIITLLNRAATINRFDDIYYRNLAQALLLQVGQDINGIKDPTQISPTDRQNIQNLTAASVNAAARASDLSPQNAQNWLVRGSVYSELVPIIGNAGDFAVQALQKATALEPTNPDDQTQLGLAYLAIANFNQQLTTSKDPATQKTATDAMNQNLASAEQAFNQALALKSDYSPAAYQLAVIKAQEGKLDDAITQMVAVQQFNPQDVGVAFQLGMLYLRRGGTGDLASAQQALEYAVQLLPSYSNARWFLASIYEQQGQIDKAIAQIQEVAKLNPDNDLVKAKLAQLQSGSTSKTIPPTVEAGDQSATSVPDGQPTTATATSGK